MGTSKELEKKLPGITFRVVKHQLTQTTLGHFNGRVTLVAQVQTQADWDAAIVKLDGIRLFYSSMEETLSAFGMELDQAREELQVLRLQSKEQADEIACKNAELTRLRGLLALVGHDLGIEG